MLRARTRAEHDAIEQALGLTEASLTLERYARTIARFYGFWRPLEDGLRLLQSALADSGYDLAQREKTQLLVSDLHFLGQSVPSRLPLCRDLPDSTTLASAFGCLYVIEGATLGGQVISRHLQTRLGITPALGGRFFHGYGMNTGPMWKAFGRALGALAPTLESYEPVVAGAVSTFRALRLWHARTDFLPIGQ